MCLQHDSFLEDAKLTHCVAKRFLPIEHLEVDYANAPHVDFGCDDSSLFLAETFRRQVPVRSDTLRSELDGVFFSGFA